jgi:hypothetical protein
MDLDRTGAKMRKVLGRSWLTVADDLTRKASGKEGGKSKGVPGTLLRDALAEKGVALTSKEVRAITSRYGKASARAEGMRPESVPVDVTKLFGDIMEGKVAGPRLPKGTARSPGGPSAFISGAQTAAGVF